MMCDSSSIDKETLKIYSRLNKIIDSLFLRRHPLIESMDETFRSVIGDKRPSTVYQKMDEKEEFQKRFWSCIWKMRAIHYHFNNIIKLEEEYRTRLEEYYSRIHKISPGGYMAISTEKMELEFEAFLLQSKACLDIFAKSFKPYLKNDSNNIDGLKKELGRHIERNSDPICRAILTEVNNSKWLEEFEYIDQRHSNRDWIAHYGKMLTSPINIYPDEDKVVYVSSFFKDRITKKRVSVKDYAEETMKNIFTLIHKCHSILLLT